MSTVRRINLSQVRGGESNDTDEIRPRGEMSLYDDGDGKLELLISDGQRTNLRNKVLSKGTFYGGDADSGDGNGYDTIKLIPDVGLYQSEAADQHIIIDPTVPNHIHVRAGGTIDNSTAELFLGGERNNVRVSDSDDYVSITTDTDGEPNRWSFDTDGDLTLPNDAGKIKSSVSDGGGIQIDAKSDFEIKVTQGTGEEETAIWSFEPNGDLVFPDGTTQSSAYTGSGGSSDRLVNGDIEVVLGETGLLEFPIPDFSGEGVVTPALSFPVGEGVGSFFGPTPVGGLGIGVENNVWTFATDGSLGLPGGGVIGEGVVTDNPTIELTPDAAFSDATQKLVIKGGGAPVDDYHLHLTTGDLETTSIILGIDEHNVRTNTVGGIEITSRDYENDVSSVWGFSEIGALILPPSDPDNFNSGQIYANNGSGFLNLNVQGFTDPEFYGGVRLGNDDNKPVDIWTSFETQWRFGGDGSFTIPGDIRSEGNINIDINLADSTLRRWQFGEDGDLTLPGSLQLSSGGIIKGTDGLENGITIGEAENTAITLAGTTFFQKTARFYEGIFEAFSALQDATGVVEHDCADGSVFYHTSPDANWTVNLTNFGLSTSEATTITIIISQGETGYYPNALQIGGEAQTINWQGNTTPTPSISRVDVVSFSIFRTGSGYTVLGQLTGF